MNIKVCLLVLQFLAFAYASSHYRYHNRAFTPYTRPYTVTRLRKQAHPQEHLNVYDCGFGICEQVPDYRENEVKRLVENHEAVHSFLKGNIVEPAETFSIGKRNGDENQSFCKTRNVSAAPRLMMDIDSIQRRIVNVKNYSQILKYETCDLESGDECFSETLLDTRTKCMQRFSNIKLVTVDVDHGVLEYRTFRIPSTCVCTYMRDF